MDVSRLAAASFPFREQPVEQALAAVARAGFTKVELLGRMPHFSLDPSECDLTVLAQQATDHGLTICGLGTYGGAGFASGDPDKAQQDWDDLTRAIDAAAQLGARVVRVFRAVGEYDDPRYIPAIVPWYQKAARYAAPHNIVLGIENHGGGISGSGAALRDLAQQVGCANFGVLYDACNLVTAGVDYQREYAAFKDHIVHVHLKDGRSEKNSQKTTMLGEGEVRIAKLLRDLDAIGYEGDITLEYEVETTPAETGLKQWKAYITQMLANL